MHYCSGVDTTGLITDTRGPLGFSPWSDKRRMFGSVKLAEGENLKSNILWRKSRNSAISKGYFRDLL